MNLHRQLKRTVAVVATAAALVAPRASAVTYVFNFDQLFMGPPPVSPITPWIVATVEDLVSGGVRMTIQNSLDLGTQVVQKVYFNLNPVYDPANLTFTFVGSSGGFNLPSVTTGADSFKADGDGKYDILFSFDAPWGLPAQYLPDCFSAAEWITYDIGGIPGLSAADFWFMSTPAGPTGSYLAAAYIPCQTWVCVPEPSVLALGSLGLCFWLGRRKLGWRRR